MKKQLDLLKLAIIGCAAVYAYLLFQLFTKNLAIWPDYPFHLHSIWAASKGFLANDPFLAGGAHVTLAYGAPVTLMGVLLYPLLNIYTVAFLLAVAVPVLWISSKALFDNLVREKAATIGALLVLLNPFTMYLFLTAKLPFIWGLCFAVASVYSYFEGRWLFAVLLGALAVITHPMAIFLLGAPILFNRNLIGWLKTYFIPSAIFLAQLALLFGLSFAPTSEIHGLNILFLSAALGIALWLRRDCWVLCVAGFLVLLGSVASGVFGLPVPGALVLDRVGFIALLFVFPFLMQRHAILAPVFMILSAGVVVGHVSMPDDPVAYDNLPPDLVENLSHGEVRYASDGSALYILPQLGIKFSNAGRESSEPVPDNAVAYMERIDADNVSFILVYESSPEENVIQELGYPLIYSRDNIKIYRTHLTPENLL